MFPWLATPHNFKRLFSRGPVFYSFKVESIDRLFVSLFFFFLLIYFWLLQILLVIYVALWLFVSSFRGETSMRAQTVINGVYWL